MGLLDRCITYELVNFEQESITVIRPSQAEGQELTGGDCSVVELVRSVLAAYGRDNDLSGVGDVSPAELISADPSFGSFGGAGVVYDSFGRLAVVLARRHPLRSALGSEGETIVNIPRHDRLVGERHVLSPVGET